MEHMKLRRGARGVLGRWWGLALVIALASVPAYAVSSDPLNLEEAVNLAVQRSEEVVSAERALRSAQIALEEARSAYGTGVTLSASAEIDESRRVDADASVRATGALGAGMSWTATAYSKPPNSDTTGNAVSVTYQLWPPATDRREWTALAGAEHAIAEARTALARARAEAGLNALQLYRTLQLNVERLRLAEAMQDEARAKLTQVEEAIAAGRASMSDKINQEIVLLEHRESVASRRAQVAKLRSQLARLIGRRPAEIVLSKLDESTLTDVVRGPTDLPDQEEAIQAAVAVSADVRAAGKALEDAKQAVAAARRNSGMSLSLNGRVEQDLSGEVDWLVGVSGSYALSDAGRRRRAVESAELNLERAQTAYDTAIRSVSEAVTESLHSIESAGRSLEIAVAVEELRRLDVSVAQQQAAQGVLSEAQFSARRRSLQAAILDRVAAELTLQLERSRFDLLVGRTPDVI